MISSNEFLSGNFAPVRSERDIANLPVTGYLPKELRGALYRVGPNPQFPPRDDHYHWFAGDGMVHAFSFDDGAVAYKNRWMRTPKWQLENEAGNALFGTFGNPATSDPSVIGRSTATANTNIVWHGGRLFALEESHQPFEFDPLTLESMKHQNLGGRIAHRFTAHPKADAQTGELHFFAYSTGGPGTTDMLYGTLDGHCEVTRLLDFKAPYPSMVHDFVTTRSHVLFPFTPLTSSMERVMHGKPMFAWEPERCTHVGVLPRNAEVEEMRWLATEPCHVFHFMNAWEDEEKIVVYAMESEIAPGMPYPDGRPGDAAKGMARLCRWTIALDPSSKEIKRECMDALPAEFPRIDERYVGQCNRYGWYVCHADEKARDGARSVLYGTLVCFDFETGRPRRYVLPAGDVISEPVFVPREPSAPEGDGWLLAVAWREGEQRSDLLVFNATDIEDGPIAMVHLPCRVPFGFHGAWRPATT